MMKIFFPILILCVLGSCIPTVEVEDPIVSEKITITTDYSSLMVGEESPIVWSYKNEYGVEMALEPQWNNSNPSVAFITNGNILGLANGQTTIQASTIGIDGQIIESNELLFRVLDDLSELAVVSIVTSTSTMQTGESIQLTYSAKDGNGDNFIGTEVSWISSNQTVATVTNEGLVMALADGSTNIMLTIDGVSSSPLAITVGSTANLKSGEFQNARYSATGMATLMHDASSNLILSFSSDFQTQFLAGTWVYLANSTSGGVVKSSGLPVKNISQNISGAQSFNITTLDPDADLETYKYVIILCEPFGLEMAYAELK